MPFDPTDAKWTGFLRYVSSLPKEEVERKNRERHEEIERLYRHFKECFSKGICDGCGKPLATFSKSELPCFHWLLRPKGVKKKDLEFLFTTKGYSRTAAYIRWIANEEIFLSRINDLADEGNTEAVFHWSATYKHIKWTFWCTPNDYNGHQGSKVAYPHFHVEIRLSGQVFVRFNDFHIPFTDEDLFDLRCNLDSRSPIKQSFGIHGAGMRDAVAVPIEKIISDTQVADDESKGVYRIHTMAIAKEGETISEDFLEEVIRKSKETGHTVAYYLNKSGLNTHIVVSPIDTVPDKEIRTNPRKKED